MAKYLVLRPIEHGVGGESKLYLPKGLAGPEKPFSGSKGEPIAVDRSGIIELSDEAAGKLQQGQIPLYLGKPDPIGAPEARAKLAAKNQAEQDAAVKAEQEELEEFRAWKEKKKK